MIDLYEVLGVPKEATPKEIKQAYRKRARETHPDHGGNATAFKTVNDAYQILSDPDQRAFYDRDHHKQNHGPQTPSYALRKDPFSRAFVDRVTIVWAPLFWE